MKHNVFFLSIGLFTFISCEKNNVTSGRSDSAQKEYVSAKKFDNNYKPDVSPSKFSNSTNVTNQYFPVSAGKKYIYEGQTADGLEHIEEQRLSTTKTILKITCIAVNFKAYLVGKLIEEAYDWYAQDNDGNLWYFGEAVDNYDAAGTLADHAGSWEAGRRNAQPGIIMLANPQAGVAYREEYFFKHAEDEAEILETGFTVTTSSGTFSNCIKTRNFTRLEPDLIEHKIYAPGYGLIKEIDLIDNMEILLKAIQ